MHCKHKSKSKGNVCILYYCYWTKKNQKKQRLPRVQVQRGFFREENNSIHPYHLSQQKRYIRGPTQDKISKS